MKKQTTLRVFYGLYSVLGLMVFAGLILSSAPAFAAPKADWLMWMNNKERSGYTSTTIASNVNRYSVVWTFNGSAFSSFYASAAVADVGGIHSYAYFGDTSGKFYCLDALTGQEIAWSPLTLSGEIKATPAIDKTNNVIFVGAGTNLYAFDPVSGTAKGGGWPINTGGNIGYSSPAYYSAGGSNYVYVANSVGIVTEAQYDNSGNLLGTTTLNICTGQGQGANCANIFNPVVIVDGVANDYLLFSTINDSTNGGNKGKIYRADIPGLGGPQYNFVIGTDQYYTAPMYDGTYFYTKGAGGTDNELKQYNLAGVMQRTTGTAIDDSRCTPSFYPTTNKIYMVSTASGTGYLWDIEQLNLITGKTNHSFSASEHPSARPDSPDSSPVIAILESGGNAVEVFGTKEGSIQIFQAISPQHRVGLCTQGATSNVITTPAIANVDGGANPMIFAGCMEGTTPKMFGIGIDSLAPVIDCSESDNGIDPDTTNPSKDPVTFYCTMSELNTGRNPLYNRIAFRASRDGGITWDVDWTSVLVTAVDGTFDSNDIINGVPNTEPVTFTYEFPNLDTDYDVQGENVFDGEYIVEFSSCDVIGGLPANCNVDQGTTTTRFTATNLLIDRTHPKDTEARCGAGNETTAYINSANGFPVTWAGAWSNPSDPGLAPSGLSGAYDIVYRLAGGPAFLTWLSNTTGTTGNFGEGDVPVHLTTGTVYEFKAAARDNVGNIEDTNFPGAWPIAGDAECTAVIDFDAPSSTTVSPQYANRLAPNFPVSWSSTDTGGSGLLDTPLYDIRYKDQLDGTWTNWLAPTTNASGVFGQGGVPITPQSGHTYYFETSARDKAGNNEPWVGGAGEGDTHTLVDLDDPVAVATCPALVSTSGFNVDWSNASDAGGSGLTGSYDVWVNDNGGGWNLYQAGWGSTSLSYTGVDNHTYEFEIIAYDLAGNVDGQTSAAECSTAVDLTAPEIYNVDSHDDSDTIDDDEVYHSKSPAQQVRIVVDTSATEAELSEQVIWITSAATGYDSGEYVMHYEGNMQFSFLWDTTTGVDEASDYQVNIRLADLAGNTTNQLNALTIIIDNTDPAPTINDLGQYYINTTTPTLSGDVTDAGGGTIRLMEYRIVKNGTPQGWITINTFAGTAGGTHQDYTITPDLPGEGAYSIQVRALDSAKNQTSEANYASTTFVVDTVPPGIENIDSNDITDTTDNDEVYHAGQQVRIHFNAENNETGLLGRITIACPGNDPETLVSNAVLAENGTGMYYYDWDTTGAEVQSPDLADRCRVTFTLTDLGGNQTTDSSFRIIIDNTQPAASLVTPSPNIINHNVITIDGTADDTDRGLATIQDVQYRLVTMLNGQPVSYGAWTQATPGDGAFHDGDQLEAVGINLDLEDGDYMVQMRAQDTASNWTLEADYGAVLFTIDTVGPIISSIDTRDDTNPLDNDEVYHGGQKILIIVVERDGESDLPIRGLSIQSATTGYSLLNQTMTAQPSGIYVFVWDTSALTSVMNQAPDYVATAVLGDAAGNLSNEAVITMVIDNTPPDTNVGLVFDYNPATPGKDCTAFANGGVMSVSPSSCQSLVTLGDGITQILYVRDANPQLMGQVLDTGGATVVSAQYRLQHCASTQLPCPADAWENVTNPSGDGWTVLTPVDGTYDSPMENINMTLGPFQHNNMYRFQTVPADNAGNTGITDVMTFIVDLSTTLNEQQTNFYLNLPIEKNQTITDAQGNTVYVLTYRTDDSDATNPAQHKKTLADGWSDDIIGQADTDVRRLTVTITALGQLSARSAPRSAQFISGMRSITFQSPSPDVLGDFLASTIPGKKMFLWRIADYGIVLQIGYEYRIDIAADDFAGNTAALSLWVTPMVNFGVGTTKLVLDPEADDPRINSPSDWRVVGRKRLETEMDEVVQYRIYFKVDPGSSNAISEDDSGIYRIFVLDKFPAPIKYAPGTTYIDYLETDRVTKFQTHRGPFKIADPKAYVLEQVGGRLQIREYGSAPPAGAATIGIRYGWEITADLRDGNGALVFPSGALSSELALTYRSIVGAGAQRGIVYSNESSVFLLQTQDNTELSFYEMETGRADVIIVQDKIFREEGIVMGKVFLDANGNGFQDGNERGVQGVRLIMEDGAYVDTGEDGLFSLVGIRKGDHALKIDPDSLPIDMKPSDSKAQLFYMPEGGTTHVSFVLILK